MPANNEFADQNRYNNDAVGDDGNISHDIPRQRDHGYTNHPSRDRAEPAVRIELVVADGPDGQELHKRQAAAVWNVLAAMAHRRSEGQSRESL